MKDEIHTITVIVTRDETGTGTGSSFVDICPKDTKLKKIKGEWVSENNVKKITTLALITCKQLLGHVPDAGSKETKTIDEAKLDVLKRS